MLLIDLVAFTAALATTLAVIPIIIEYATWRPLLNRSGEPGLERDAPLVPRLGGIAVFAGIVVAIAVASTLRGVGIVVPTGWTHFAPLMVAGATVVFALGLIDDLRGVKPLWKLAAQTVAACAAWYAGVRIEVIVFPPSTVVDLGALAFPVTVLWLVGVSNALNLIDGLDGLAGTVTVIALGCVIGASLVLNHNGVMLLSWAMLGATLGFLRYNWHPARIFLGDSGSLVVGFMLAVATVESARRADGAILSLVPILALAYPLLDTGVAILRRSLRGEPLARADGRHIHQQFVTMGYGQTRAVGTIAIFAAALAALALTVTFARPVFSVFVALVALAVLMSIFAWGLRWLQYDEFTEARATVLSAALRARGVLRNKIIARDAERHVSRAEEIADVERILAEYAPTLGLAHMQICRESSRRRLPESYAGGALDVYKVDFPIVDLGHSTPPDPIVLRIWCHTAHALAHASAERVAQTLAPTIRERLAALQADDVDYLLPRLRISTAAAPVADTHHTPGDHP